MTGYIGYVHIEHGQLLDYAVSRKAAQSADATALCLQSWILKSKPQVVVTEKITPLCRRGKRSCELTRLLGVIASYHDVFDISLVLDRGGRTIHQQAEHLVRIYPDVESRMIKPRKIYGAKDRDIVLFDALTLAHTIIENPTMRMAREMG